jgi:preprotein translocase subunit SecD
MAKIGSRRSFIFSVIITLVVSFGSLFATLTAGWGPKLGLDLAGGVSAIYKPATATSTAKLNEAISILSNRVNGLGVSGATVNLQGNEIVVSVPGVKDARAVLEEVGQTAQLLFRPVLCESLGAKKEYYQNPNATLPSCGSKYLLSAANLNPVTNNSVAGFSVNTVSPDPQFSAIAPTQPAYDDPSKSVLLPVLGAPGVRYVLGPAELAGTAIAKAVAQLDTANQWVVSYTLTSTGSPEWDSVAKANFHAMVAIELDGVIQSAPIIQPTQSSFSSFDGTGQISGSFTQASAQKLALAMNYGALPVRLVPLTTETVSPTLGHSALVAGLLAGLVGLALVLLYTILYYRLLGFVILLGLGATGALLWAIISALAHTSAAPSFDLAGVTGLIVSIGITVDSYIVYFERLKDEARAGRSLRTSVDRGFRSAWRTVLAADFVSLLAAVLLYLIAVGSVRGFAFFLGLSTLMDVFMTWYFTRPLVILLGRRAKNTNSALSMAAGLDLETAND